MEIFHLGCFRSPFLVKSELLLKESIFCFLALRSAFGLPYLFIASLFELIDDENELHLGSRYMQLKIDNI